MERDLNTKTKTMFDSIQVQLYQRSLEGQREEKTDTQKVKVTLNLVAEFLGFQDLPETVSQC